MSLKAKKGPTGEKTDSEMMRRFKANPFIFIGSFLVLLLVIVTFLAPQTCGMDTGSSADLTFGYYDKVPISYVRGNYFARYYDMAARRQQNNMNNENFNFMGYEIWKEAFEAAAMHTAMLQEMKKSGYTVPSKTVDLEVAKLPYFQENGRFSTTRFRQMDDNDRMALWRQVQEDLAKGIFYSDVMGLLKPAAEAEFISSMAAVQRSFAMAVFSVSAYPESEYQAFAEERSDLFRSVHLSMITVNSGEREAKKVLASITNGEITFEDAARQHSQDAYADRGGDMGSKMAHELSYDIPEDTVREAAAALAKGAFSPVMKTGSGWTFFRAEEDPQDADSADSLTMEKIRNYMRNFEGGRMEDWAVAQANSFVALVNEHGFEEALAMQEAAQAPVERRNFGPIPLNYGSVGIFTTVASQQVSELSGAANDDNFWKTAFTTPVNTPAQPLVQGSNVLVLFPTEESTAEESVIENINSMFNAYIDYFAEQSLQQYFMNSPKMEDKFIDVYMRFFMN